jgi:hypothetical protein
MGAHRRAAIGTARRKVLSSPLYADADAGLPIFRNLRRGIENRIQVRSSRRLPRPGGEPNATKSGEPTGSGVVAEHPCLERVGGSLFHHGGTGTPRVLSARVWLGKGRGLEPSWHCAGVRCAFRTGLPVDARARAAVRQASSEQTSASPGAAQSRERAPQRRPNPGRQAPTSHARSLGAVIRHPCRPLRWRLTAEPNQRQQLVQEAGAVGAHTSSRRPCNTPTGAPPRLRTTDERDPQRRFVSRARTRLSMSARRRPSPLGDPAHQVDTRSPHRVEDPALDGLVLTPVAPRVRPR